MSRRFWTVTILLGVMAYAFALRGESAFGLPFTFAPPNNPTIPTRTPTPGPTSPPPPTATPGQGGGGGNATAVPTSTIEATATATTAPTITATFIPVGEILPTAEGCGQPPTIQAQNPINVRLGPGSDYEVVATLAYLDVRPIIGRAADAEWWLIQLENGVSGWVFDAVVVVHGYTGNVPIVPAPPINGQTPTPGALWEPTPNPVCTIAPTNTTTPTPTAESTTENGVAATPTDTVNEITATPGDVAANAAQSAATDAPLPTQTAVAPPTLAAAESTNDDPANGDSATTEIFAPIAAAAPLDDAPDGRPVDWLLPVAGLLLIGAGAAAFVAQRRRADDGTE